MLNWDDVPSWRVLLVDDEPDNLEVVAETLEFHGATVKTAANGQLALDALKDFKPDVILLDLSMPVMDGWQTLRHLRENPETRILPIISLSAHAIVGDKERALQVGFDAYVTKPINVPTFIQDLKTALESTSQSIKP